MDFGLRDHHVVIVGGSRGIGLEIARGFQDQGAHVTITSEHPNVFEAQTTLNASDGPRVGALRFDISSRDEIVAAFSQLGRIDVLINNSGIAWYTNTNDRSPENYDRFVKMLMVNLAGTWCCTLEAIPHMQDGGRIIFTSSISGRLGSPDHAGYAATKHGINGMVRCLAKDVGPLGISVNAVSPGSTATEINLTTLRLDRQSLAVKNMALHPALLDPSDHVGAYLFLASAAASSITGQTITVDRGQTCV